MTKKQAGMAPVEAAAWVKNTTRAVNRVKTDLLHLENIVRLCAFAYEAKRTARGLQLAQDVYPEIFEGCGDYVGNPDELSRMAAPVAEVLTHVADELASAYVMLDDPETLT